MVDESETDEQRLHREAEFERSLRLRKGRPRRSGQLSDWLKAKEPELTPAQYLARAFERRATRSDDSRNPLVVPMTTFELPARGLTTAIREAHSVGKQPRPADVRIVPRTEARALRWSAPEPDPESSEQEAGRLRAALFVPPSQQTSSVTGQRSANMNGQVGSELNLRTLNPLSGTQIGIIVAVSVVLCAGMVALVLGRQAARKDKPSDL